MSAQGLQNTIASAVLDLYRSGSGSGGGSGSGVSGSSSVIEWVSVLYSYAHEYMNHFYIHLTVQ